MSLYTHCEKMTIVGQSEEKKNEHNYTMFQSCRHLVYLVHYRKHWAGGMSSLASRPAFPNTEVRECMLASKN